MLFFSPSLSSIPDTSVRPDYFVEVEIAHVRGKAVSAFYRMEELFLCLSPKEARDSRDIFLKGDLESDLT